MARKLLICGLLAGFVAGLFSFAFMKVAGEPAVDQAIAFEGAHSAPAHTGQAEAQPVSRAKQKTVGLLSVAIAYGVALGGIFALVFAYAYGRAGRASPAMTAACLAAIAFVVVYLVPFVKYPANPPSVGNPDTITERTLLYLTMVWTSILAAVAAVRLRRTLVKRHAPHVALLLAGAAYVVVVVAAGLALPGIHEVPSAFPATTLWRFREASVGAQLVMWTSIGLVFSALAQRVMTRRPILSLGARRSGATVPAGE